MSKLATLLQSMIEKLNSTSNKIYPVGSIYLSVNDTSPATLFGGEWEQIKDVFLLSAGSTYTAGEMGGEASHKLTKSELPAIGGSVVAGTGGEATHLADGYGVFRAAYGDFSVENSRGTGRPTKETSAAWAEEGDSTYGYERLRFSVGGNVAHNNMPPYLTVYMWKRIA